MKPYAHDGYLIDLYKGGEGRLYVMIMDGKDGAHCHVDVDFKVLVNALGVLFQQLCEPLPPDADLNEGEASIRPSDVGRYGRELPATP